VTLSAALSEDCARRAREQFRSNFLRNLQTIRSCRGVGSIAGELAGEPVIVAGAGPSLTAALPALKASGLPVIAVDRAARPLLAAGIRPGWIITAEISPVVGNMLEDLEGLDRVPLVFDPTCCPEIVDRYPGPLYTFDRPNIVLGKGALRLGTGVATYAVGLAEVLGAARVILVGVDLAYPDGKRHAAGVPEIPGVAFEGEGRVQSVAGGTVESDVYFAACAEELGAAARSIRLVQTSPRGAFIDGADHMTLEEALQ